MKVFCTSFGVEVLSFSVLFNFNLFVNTAELMEGCLGYHFED